MQLPQEFRGPWTQAPSLPPATRADREPSGQMGQYSIQRGPGIFIGDVWPENVVDIIFTAIRDALSRSNTPQRATLRLREALQGWNMFSGGKRYCIYSIGVLSNELGFMAGYGGYGVKAGYLDITLHCATGETSEIMGYGHRQCTGRQYSVRSMGQCQCQCQFRDMQIIVDRSRLDPHENILSLRDIAARAITETLKDREDIQQLQLPAILEKDLRQMAGRVGRLPRPMAEYTSEYGYWMSPNQDVPPRAPQGLQIPPPPQL